MTILKKTLMRYQLIFKDVYSVYVCCGVMIVVV